MRRAKPGGDEARSVVRSSSREFSTKAVDNHVEKRRMLPARPHRAVLRSRCSRRQHRHDGLLLSRLVGIAAANW